MPSHVNYWILEPASTFPLHIICDDREVVAVLSDLLAANLHEPYMSTIYKAEPLIRAHQMRCPQIEEYMDAQAANDEDENGEPQGVDDYWRGFTELLVHTHNSGVTHYRDIEQAKASQVVSAMRVLASADACECCQKAAEKAYPLNGPSPVPVHVGCQCTLTMELIDEEE
jgi:hypothetical protein